MTDGEPDAEGPQLGRASTRYITHFAALTANGTFWAGDPSRARVKSGRAPFPERKREWTKHGSGYI